MLTLLHLSYVNVNVFANQLGYMYTWDVHAGCWVHRETREPLKMGDLIATEIIE